jgi:hypothetical protein
MDIVDSLAGAASVHEQAVGLLASATHLLNSLGTSFPLTPPPSPLYLNP